MLHTNVIRSLPLQLTCNCIIHIISELNTHNVYTIFNIELLVTMTNVPILILLENNIELNMKRTQYACILISTENNIERTHML